MIIFSTYKEPLEIATVYAVRSWNLAFPGARIVFFGDFQTFPESGGLFFKNVKMFNGLPLINDMFEQAMYGFNDPGPFLFINADIIVTESLRLAAEFLEQAHARSRCGYLAVGQRTELTAPANLVLYDHWETLIAAKNGSPRLLPACGADWFLFNGFAFANTTIPPFMIARTAYDNWLIFDALKRGVQVINCTDGVTVYHQTHPEQKVRQSEEALENHRLAKESRPDWDAWHGWVNQASITLSELRNAWDIL